MRRYELMLLLRPDLEDEKLQSAVEKVTRAIVNAGGSLSKVSPWGKRRLAYEIQHYREASYFLIHFDIQPSAIRELERGMLITEEILRHLVTVLEERPELTEDELAAAAAEAVEAPDERESDEEPVEESAEQAAPEERPGDADEPAAGEPPAAEPAAATAEA
jgi:small subunit ribosomal protein S6